MARNNKPTSTEGKVSKDDMVAVIGTGKVEFMPKGKEFLCHSIAAAKLVDKGKATYAGKKKTEEEPAA